jgi:hypothetical protein
MPDDAVDLHIRHDLKLSVPWIHPADVRR